MTMNNTSFYTFIANNPVKIPIMQRDYAQGRISDKITRIRSAFLDAIFTALKNERPLTLDFVYGYKKGQDFYPLDGQQRLTTLFLLHWYIAAREGHLDSASDILSRFSYETRHSSRVFCGLLSKHHPDCFNESIDEHIANESWFMQSWKHDATINSMLIMIREIHKFYDSNNICCAWEKLTAQEDDSTINFHLLPMDNFGLSDELYIKMNSRGKELTEFEIFKAQFSESLTFDEKEIFNSRIDGVWSDLFWDLYKDNGGDVAQIADSAFMRFYDYAESIIGKEDRKRLFAWLDIFVKLFKDNKDFFSEQFYFDEIFEEEKVRLFFGDKEANLFKVCADNFSTSKFSVGQQLMLYACILHLENDTKYFNARIRQLRNLIANSPDTLRDEYRSALLEATKEIIFAGDLNALENIVGQHFNSRQIKEEIEKQDFIGNEELYLTICRLEDNRLLRGCLAAIHVNDSERLPTRATAFLRLFDGSCDYDLISCTLLTYGDYSQKESNGRLRFGNKDESTWRDLIIPSTVRSGYEDNFKPTLLSLLDGITKDESIAHQLKKRVDCQIAENIDKCLYDWKYYFLKSPDFRMKSGYYIRDKEYEVLKLNRTVLQGKHWNPFLLAVKSMCNKGALEEYNSPLIIGSVTITSNNEGFVFNGDDAVLVKADADRLIIETDKGYFLQISQENGVDIEDRVEKCAGVINKMFSDDYRLAKPE
jgi:hypothetical protein